MLSNKETSLVYVLLGYDMQGVFLKCAEILPMRVFDNVEDWGRLKKIVAQKILSKNYFLTEYFFFLC
jgi:hypothetical protein